MHTIKNYLAGIDGLESAIRTEKSPYRRKRLLAEQSLMLEKVKYYLESL